MHALTAAYLGQQLDRQETSQMPSLDFGSSST